MKEDPKELTWKKYVQLEKRRNELWETQRNLPYRPLKEPIQDGWNLSVELSEEALRRDDGEFMAKALALVTKGKCVTKDSKKISLIRKNTKFVDVRPIFINIHESYDGKIYKVYVGPEIQSLTEKEFNKIDNPRISKWFSRCETTRVIKWSGQTVTDVKYQLNIREHYFVVKVKKRILTKVQDINPSLEKELAEVQDRLKPYYRAYPGKGHWRYDMRDQAKVFRKHIKNALQKVKKGELENALDDHKTARRRKSL